MKQKHSCFYSLLCNFVIVSEQQHLYFSNLKPNLSELWIKLFINTAFNHSVNPKALIMTMMLLMSTVTTVYGHSHCTQQPFLLKAVKDSTELFTDVMLSIHYQCLTLMTSSLIKSSWIITAVTNLAVLNLS